MIRVYTDVVADLYHWGHVEFFRHARELGDVLIVGRHDDDTVATYKRRPILTMNERIRVVAACRWVDEVVASAPLVVDAALLDRHRIDVVVHADDIGDDVVAEWYVEPVARGIYRSVPYTAGISTTEIIGRVQDWGAVPMADSRLRRGAQAIPGVIPTVRTARRAGFARRLRRLHDALAPTPFADRYWVWSGLLLGWAREGRPLAHDLWDVDFAFLEEDLDCFLAAVPALSAAGFTPRTRFCDDDGTPWEYQFRNGSTRYEFFVMEPDPARSVLRYRSFVYGPERNPREMLVSELPLQARVPFSFLGRTWHKVADHEAELAAIYGEWRTPDPGWTFLDSADIVDRHSWSRGRDRWGTPR